MAEEKGAGVVRRYKHPLLALISTLLVQVCLGRGPPSTPAEAASSGDWQITQKVDSVTGSKLTNVLLRSSKTTHDGLMFAPNAVMQFVCLKGRPLIHLMFGFQIGSKADTEVSYRFDEGPAQPVQPRILRGLQIAVIENKAEVAEFLRALPTANALYLVVNSLAEGRTSAEFRVSGAQAAVDVISAVCTPGAASKP